MTSSAAKTRTRTADDTSFRVHVLTRTLAFASQIIGRNGGAAPYDLAEYTWDTGTLEGICGGWGIDVVCRVSSRDRVTLTVTAMGREPEVTRIDLHDTRDSIRRAFRKAGLKKL
ncbi:MAG: hypothetical protein LBQ79_02560 [Deltaproteobacteria bacterium]|nr:hypothetical protein [Deltaproteobacteria bacterium]